MSARVAIAISDAHLSRRNYLYSISADKLSPAGKIVAGEIHETARRLVISGEWPGVTLLPQQE